MTKNQHRLIPASEGAEPIDAEKTSAEETGGVAEEPTEAIPAETSENAEIVPEETDEVAEGPETNQWLVDSPIDHCPVCRDHWRTDLSGQPSCTAEPPLPHCPRFPS
jgi:hypothetical protein